MARVGLLGGTFDPVHNAHLQLAQACLDECGLHAVRFIPAAVPPHKHGHGISPIGHRLNMLGLALADEARFSISEVELDPDRPSFTIDTIDVLKKQAPAGTRHYFIIGSDAMLEIDTWHRYEELLAAVSFIVATRPGYSPRPVTALLAQRGFRIERGSPGRWRHPERNCEVRFLSSRVDDISSTRIRRCISRGTPWRHLVPAPVSAYISAHKLYLNNSDDI